MSDQQRGFSTRSIRLAGGKEDRYGSLVPPLYMSSTFVFPSAEVGGARFAGTESGMIYSRLGNPTVEALEQAVAELEGGEAALAFGSGMGAISAVLLTLVESGDHILCSNGLYGCTFDFLSLLKRKFGVDFSLAEMSDRRSLAQAIRQETKVVFVESPINPTMKLVDLELVAEVAHARGAKVVVDNTFLTPYLQRPIEFGCDLVVHSATKYLGGHGDLIAGIEVGRKALLDEMRMSALKDFGAVMSPLEAWLILRGLKTLSLRMDRHCASASKVAKFLQGHPKVKRVMFPGLDDFPQQQLREKQMRGPGGMISFEVASLEAGRALLNGVQIAKLAVSLGEATTLIQHPASMTHAVIPAAVRQQEMGISDGLIRLSVGLEDADDLIDDLQQGLAHV